MVAYSDQHVDALRKKMKEDGLEAYLIVTGDPHNSEEPAPYFAAERRYFCPFDGDNAFVLITQEDAFLFTDGRFFVSAEQEIAGTYFKLMKLYTPGYPTPEEKIAEDSLYPLGTNLSLISPAELALLSKGGEVRDVDYSSLVEDRPAFPNSPLWKFDDPSYNDLTREEKIEKALAQTKKEGAEALLITTLDDIAWTLNLRGDDIPYTPVFYSYLYLSEKEGAHLFIDPKRIGFPLPDIEIHPYEEIDSFLEKRADVPTLIDPSQANAKVCSLLKKQVHASVPTRLMKAIKSEKEIANIRAAQIEDGIALLKFIDFVDQNKDKGLSEWDFAVKLGEFRKEGKHYIGDSFMTIAATGPNAAMMHYAPTAEVHDIVKDGPELLVDSGGQYVGEGVCGTTDTTRTFPLGKVSEEFKHDYTLSLKSLIDLRDAIFLEGSTGRPIDMMAREVMWKEGLDYKCGTGHGIGYVSVVHESPNGFRYRAAAGKDDGCKIVPGMITSDEPGVYKAGRYGIRIEDDILCVPAFSRNDGNFYRFEDLTVVPVDVTALDLSIMTDDEIASLNAYHASVREKLLPYVEGHLKEVLIQKTEPVHR